MTQLIPQAPPGQDEALRAALLARLRKTPAEAVGEAAETTEGLSAEDEERLRRRTRTAGHKTRTNIRRAFSWFMFAVVCGLILAAVVGFLVLLWGWVGTFRSNADKLGTFLGMVVSYVLVVLGTLFVEGVLRNRDD